MTLLDANPTPTVVATGPVVTKVESQPFLANLVQVKDCVSGETKNVGNGTLTYLSNVDFSYFVQFLADILIEFHTQKYLHLLLHG